MVLAKVHISVMLFSDNDENNYVRSVVLNAFETRMKSDPENNPDPLDRTAWYILLKDRESLQDFDFGIIVQKLIRDSKMHKIYLLKDCDSMPGFFNWSMGMLDHASNAARDLSLLFVAEENSLHIHAHGSHELPVFFFNRDQHSQFVEPSLFTKILNTSRVVSSVLFAPFVQRDWIEKRQLKIHLNACRAASVSNPTSASLAMTFARNMQEQNLYGSVTGNILSVTYDSIHGFSIRYGALLPIINHLRNLYVFLLKIYEFGPEHLKHTFGELLKSIIFFCDSRNLSSGKICVIILPPILEQPSQIRIEEYRKIDIENRRQRQPYSSLAVSRVFFDTDFSQRLETTLQQIKDYASCKNYEAIIKIVEALCADLNTLLYNPGDLNQNPPKCLSEVLRI